MISLTSKTLVKERKSIGVIKMEVYRNIEPVDSFLDTCPQTGRADMAWCLCLTNAPLASAKALAGCTREYGVEPDHRGLR